MFLKIFCCLGVFLHMAAGEMEDAKEIASHAGELILELKDEGRLEAKDILLPNGKKIRQTRADLEVSRYIVDELSKRYPNYGVISQDQLDQALEWHAKEFIWIVNAVDGTKNLERGHEDFHVQIGLLGPDEPILGVAYYPVKRVFVFAKKGEGAWEETAGIRKRLITRSPNENGLIRSSDFDKIEPRLKGCGWIPDQIVTEHLSSTTRLLKMINGEASLYISLGASLEGIEKKGGIWNYGANALIAREAGLILKTLKGEPLNLRKANALLSDGIVLTSDPEAYELILNADWHLE